MSKTKKQAHTQQEINGEANLPEQVELKGRVCEWIVNGKKRRYTTVVVPFREAREVFQPKVFNPLNGQGEQRGEVEAQIKKLYRAYKEGSFTPTPWAASVRPAHKDLMKEHSGHVSIQLDLTKDEYEPLALTDGQQRCAALEKLVEEAEDNDKKELFDQLMDLPIPVIVYLDGDPKEDFVNLQKGHSVDASHVLAMSIQRGMLDEKHGGDLRLAFDLAKKLRDSKNSPFYNLIRMGGNKSGSLPLAGLATTNKSNAITSLIGTIKLFVRQNTDKPDMKAAAQAFSMLDGAMFDSETSQVPHLIEDGKLLGKDNRNKTGTARLIIGITNVYAYAVLFGGLSEEEAVRHTIRASAAVFDMPSKGNLSTPTMRPFMLQYTSTFFEPINVDKTPEGLPAELLDIIGESSFRVRGNGD